MIRMKGLTSCKPFSVWAIGHSIPCRFVDWVIEPVGGFKFLLEVFSVGGGGWILGQIELS